MSEKTMKYVSEEVLEAGVQIVTTAKDEAGRWISRLEEGAETLKGRVQDSLHDMPELHELPAAIEDRVDAGRDEIRKGARQLVGRIDKRRLELWRELRKQVSQAGTRLEGGLDGLVRGVGLASRKDVHRIEAKLQRLARRVRALEKEM